jgi:hypothetical protein
MQAAAGDRPEREGRGPAKRGRPVARVRALVTPANLWSLAFFAVLLLVRFTPPRAEISTELDASWQQAYPYFHSQGFQAGIDYVFTYGPLAHLEIGHFFAAQFWTRVLVWQLGFGALTALLHVLLARRIAGIAGRAAYTLLVLLAAQVSEAYCAATIAAACVGLLDEAGRSRARLALGLLVLAALSLVKFPYFLLAALGALALAAAWSIARSRLAGLGVLAGFATSLAVLWSAAGQRPGAFLPYLETSRELARGYAQAMQLSAPGSAIALAAVTLVASLAWFAWWSLSPPRAAARLLVAAVLGGATLLAYKSSFVLFDRDGAFFLFAGVAVLLPLAARAHAPRWSAALPARAGRVALPGAAVVCALLGAPSVLDGLERWPRRELAAIPGRCADSLACLRDLPGFERAQERSAWEHATLHALPRIRALVGTRPIDYFGVGQALLLHGGFEYRPRPVFQTYAAFTPELMELNRRFYASELAPPFVIVDLDPFPYHLAPMEDSLALQTIVRDYAPVLSEQGLLLWQRRPAAERVAEAARETVLEANLPVGAWLDLTELDPGCHVARIELAPTLLGRLRELAYQPALLFLEVRTAPRTYRFRFGHEMARAGFVLEPLIGNQRDLPRWAAGLSIPRPRAIRIVTEGPGCYAREARVVLERADLRPAAPPGAAMEFVYPMFRAQPASESLSVYARSRWVSGREVLVVGVPSQLAFEVEPGDWRLRGVYGCELPPTGAATTGVDFRVTLAESERALFERALEPLHVPADRATQDLDVPFQCTSRTRILLLTAPRTRSKTAVDPAYWSELRIEPAPAPEKAAGDG